MIKIFVSIAAKNPYKITRSIAAGIVIVSNNLKKEMAFPLYDSSNTLARLQSLKLALMSVKSNASDIEIYMSNDRYLRYLKTINNRYTHQNKKYKDVIECVRDLNKKLKPKYFVQKQKSEFAVVKDLAKRCCQTARIIDR